MSVRKTPPAIRGRARVWGFGFLDWVASTVLWLCRRGAVVLLLLFGLLGVWVRANYMQARRLVAIMQARRRCYLLQLCSGCHRAGGTTACLLQGCYVGYLARSLQGCLLLVAIVPAVVIWGAV